MLLIIKNGKNMNIAEFKLSKKYVKNFNKNKTDYRVDDKGNIFLSLKWKLLMKYGTDSQKILWDKFRRKYLLGLLNKYCVEDCYYYFIGSDSVYSDIDVSISSVNAVEVLAKIYKEHSLIYKNSLDKMFDINIYASVLYYLNKKCLGLKYDNMPEDCFPKYEASYRQRCYSFVKIVMYMISQPTKDLVYFLESIPRSYQRLFNDALTMVKNTRYRYASDEENYLYLLKDYRKYLKKPVVKKADINKLMNKYSKFKFLEQETYESVGAVLHIVYKKDIPRLMYYDSIYDNLGFIFEVVLGGGKEFNILKISKYIERVIDAVQLMTENPKILFRLRSVVHILNKYRKMVNKPENIGEYISELYDIIGYKRGKNTKIIFLTVLTAFIILNIPKDELLNY